MALEVIVSGNSGGLRIVCSDENLPDSRVCSQVQSSAPASL